MIFTHTESKVWDREVKSDLYTNWKLSVGLQAPDHKRGGRQETQHLEETKAEIGILL